MKISFKTTDRPQSVQYSTVTLTAANSAAENTKQFTCPANNNFCKIPSLWKAGESNAKLNRSCFMCWLIRQPENKLSENTEKWLADNNLSHPLYEQFDQAANSGSARLAQPQRRGGRSARRRIVH